MGISIIKPDTRINFIGFRKVAYVISAICILVGVASIAMQGGPRFGIDFAGGVVVQAKIDTETDISSEQVQRALSDSGLPGMVVQAILDGKNEYMIRTSASDMDTEEIRQTVTQELSKVFTDAKIEIRRTEMVGPKVSSDLKTNALKAMFYAVLLITIYISGRFEQKWMIAGIMAVALFLGLTGLDFIGMPMSFLIIGALCISVGLCWYLKLNYALGAVVALIHDVIITIGVFSILGKEFDLTTIAALLTIIGYSLNDTIIVFDRIRENMRSKAKDSFATTINISVNQTLSRTILTSGTTLLVVLTLAILGGGAIHDFAIALLVGIAVGTYSSIFVASPILLGFGPSATDIEEDNNDK
ncbi:MAG: protein translocase subunit SecF [Proteobacteria bacterium]|nr:protein translocase subunit SecF [Pseudomonadota bacterium]MBU1612515.1 protein translocase subunit SecF [Pseudomonadota bacterium]